jgi:hypothetical protein
MNDRSVLNLNLATRPRRNRRLYLVVSRGLAALLVVLAALAAFVVLRFGGESARLKTAIAEARKVEEEVRREERRLAADIRAEEQLSRDRIDLVNGIILRKTFSWTKLFSELEAALPGPSFLTALIPGFTAEGNLALRMRVTSRDLDDLGTLIDALNARGFKDIQVNSQSRSDDGRLIAELSLTYERSL